MTVGQIIKEWREENRVSQRQFAQMAHITNTYVSALEANLNPITGKKITPTVEVLNRIANAMNISASELISKLRTGEDSETENSLSTRVNLSADATELLSIYNRLNNLGKRTLLKIANTLTVGDDFT